MVQPTNKRFVMEDKLATELALKAPKSAPTFTDGVNVNGGMNVVDGITVTGGVLSNPTISATGLISSTTSSVTAALTVQAGTNMVAGGYIVSSGATQISNAANAHSIQAGPTSGNNVRLGTDGTNPAIQGVNNGSYAALDVNPFGGNVNVGSASTTSAVLGTVNLGSASTTTTINGTANIGSASTTSTVLGTVNIGSASTTTSVLGTFTPPRGYMLVSRSVYTSSPAAFTKATYPWLRAIKVICVGGGGGAGGAAATAAAQVALGQAGAGGAYAETFITNIAGLAASETLTVGAGGTAGAAGANGGTGGDTSFGTWCVAKGGTLGAAGGASAVGTFSVGVSGVAASSSTGDIIYPGAGSAPRHYAYAGVVVRPLPGGNTLNPTPLTTPTITTTTLAGSTPGTNNFGVGGFPGINAQSQAAVAGGAGAGGLMIVELYA